MSRSPKKSFDTNAPEPNGLQLKGRVIGNKSSRPPMLRFPSFNTSNFEWDDAVAVPSVGDISTRYWHNTEHPKDRWKSECFFKSLKTVQQILIFDPYFCVDDINELRDGIVSVSKNLSHLYIITGKRCDGAEAAIKNLVLLYAKECKRAIESFDVLSGLSDKAKPQPHDRFALLDSELWHFGATVGGGHPGLNAYSCGWSDSNVQFSQFFKDAWDELSATNRSGGGAR